MEFPYISLLPEVAEVFPDLKLGCLVSEVVIEESGVELLTSMQEEIENLTSRLDAEKIREISPVKSLKQAYKKLGKDPNRYRPAAESLLRRVSKGKGLYQVNNVVDCLNLVSVKTGFSICGYDLSKISGDVNLGKGMPEEPYEGIGRGVLNIENLPVFRDSNGAFGTPTSDSARTLIDEKTKQVLMIVPSFDGDGAGLEETMSMLSELLSKYVSNASPEIKVI
ncbi:B3/B4 domain-containing protein [Marinilabilia salmonicolor]|uniref:B3/B4 domain-containing protein n=1 Tax=Marinilabilia salmonicolor TaxID=989 RepID=UPI00029AD269|nr:phenylalanine--tRNA ligase beta subunit-related protein [Marinilabilia salmonicolor]